MSTWITAEMIFSSPYFAPAPRRPLSTPRFAFLQRYRPQSCTVGYHLDVFPNRFSSPVSASSGHPPARHTFGHNLSFQRKILSFVRSGLIFLFECRWKPGSRSLCLCSHALTHVFGGTKDIELCFNNFTMFCYFAFTYSMPSIRKSPLDSEM